MVDDYGDPCPKSALIRLILHGLSFGWVIESTLSVSSSTGQTPQHSATIAALVPVSQSRTKRKGTRDSIYLEKG